MRLLWKVISGYFSTSKKSADLKWVSRAGIPVLMLAALIGAEGGSRTHTTLRSTDFKSDSGVLTSCYYALPSSIYRRFSRQSKLTSRLVSARNPLIFPSSLFRPNPLICPSSPTRINLRRHKYALKTDKRTSEGLG